MRKEISLVTAAIVVIAVIAVAVFAILRGTTLTRGKILNPPGVPPSIAGVPVPSERKAAPGGVRRAAPRQGTQLPRLP